MILTADHPVGELSRGIDFDINRPLRTMRQLIVTQLDYDLTPVAGLALVGHYLAALQPVLRRLDAALPVKSGVANSDMYVFTGYSRDAASRNCKPTVMDALHAGVHQPVGTAASGRGSKLGGVVLAMDENTASCMNFHRSTPWRRQVS